MLPMVASLGPSQGVCAEVSVPIASVHQNNRDAGKNWGGGRKKKKKIEKAEGLEKSNRSDKQLATPYMNRV